MASGKPSIRFMAALAFFCFSTAAYSSDTSNTSLPCTAPADIMATHAEDLSFLGSVGTEVGPLSSATTDPRPVAVPIPDLLTSEEISLLNESELVARIALIEQTISSLFDHVPSLRPVTSLTTEAGCF